MARGRTGLIASPLRPDFWRAQTDNDRGRNNLQSQGVWRDAHQDTQLRRLPEWTRAITLKFSRGRPAQSRRRAVADDLRDLRQRRRRRDREFSPAKTDLPNSRLGMQMALPAGFERITWLGPGPQETYSDRKDSRVGVYRSTVDNSSTRITPSRAKPETRRTCAGLH